MNIVRVGSNSHILHAALFYLQPLRDPLKGLHAFDLFRRFALTSLPPSSSAHPEMQNITHMTDGVKFGLKVLLRVKKLTSLPPPSAHHSPKLLKSPHFFFFKWQLKESFKRNRADHIVLVIGS